MKRSPLPDRAGPLRRAVPLTGGQPLRRTRLVARVPDKPARRARNTGPTEKVRLLVVVRAGGEKGHPGWCEWIDCTHLAVQTHHRRDRGAGGRFGEAAVKLNQPAWLVRLCLYHHGLVTNPVGLDRAIAEAFGYLLTSEQQDAREVPVLTRHSRALVLLDDQGGWTDAP